MKLIRNVGICILGGCILVMTSCASMNKTGQGAAIGAGAGAAVGAGVGAIAGSSGNKGGAAAIGAGIGAVVGGVAGALIGKKMDKQAEELKQVEGAQVETVNDGEAIKVTFESGILFATNKSDLNSTSRNSLTKFATSLKNNPDTNVTIEGHTDSTGSDSVNQPLSENRAMSVADYLAGQGVNRSRMVTVGYSSDKPIASNSTADGRAKNRRVDIYITANQKMINEAKAGTLK